MNRYGFENVKLKRYVTLSNFIYPILETSNIVGKIMSNVSREIIAFGIATKKRNIFGFYLVLKHVALNLKKRKLEKVKTTFENFNIMFKI